MDEFNVYFLEPLLGNVRAVPKAGGPSITLASGQRKPWRIAIDAQNVYWTNSLGGAVMKVAKTGGTPTVVAAASSPAGLAAVGEFLYFTAVHPRGDTPLLKAPKAGGDAVIVYPATHTALSTFTGTDMLASGRFIGVVTSVGAVVIIDTSAGDSPIANLMPPRGLGLGPDYTVGSWGTLGRQLISWGNLLPTGAAPLPGRDVTGAEAVGYAALAFATDQCGAYGYGADLVAYAPGSVPLTLPKGPGAIVRLVSDGQSVYWTSAQGVWRKAIP